MTLQGAARAMRSGLTSAVGQWRSLATSQHCSVCRPFSSSAPEEGSQSTVESLPPEKRKALVNMMLYRAKQRGFLELDLLMGKYAEKNIPKMSDHKLLAFNALLLEENPDLFKWLTGQLDPPPNVANNEAFKVSHKAHNATVAEHGKEWVRGWSDAGTDMTAK